MEAVTDFIFLGSRITVDGDCSCETKRCLILEMITMINLDSTLISRDKNWLKKVYMVKTMIFSSSHLQM